MTGRVTVCSCALLLLVALGIALAYPLVGHTSGTGTVTGTVFHDDDGNLMLSTSTDSNGVWDQDVPEGIFAGVGVLIDDGYELQYVSSNFSGVYAATVETDFPVTLTIRLWDPNVPLHYIATTDLVQVVDVDPGETTVVPDFGYGPRE